MADSATLGGAILHYLRFHDLISLRYNQESTAQDPNHQLPDQHYRARGSPVQLSTFALFTDRQA